MTLSDLLSRIDEDSVDPVLVYRKYLMKYTILKQGIKLQLVVLIFLKQVSFNKKLDPYLKPEKQSKP